MNKTEFAELHRLLAKLKYDALQIIISTSNENMKKDYEELNKAIDKIMLVAIIDSKGN